MARLVSAKSLYLPVPTISRDRYFFPASSKRSSMVILNRSATSFFSPLTVIFIRTKKIRIHADHPLVAREYGFKFVPRREPKREFDFHASLRRCDPDQVQRVTCISGSQSDDARHP